MRSFVDLNGRIKFPGAQVATFNVLPPLSLQQAGIKALLGGLLEDVHQHYPALSNTTLDFLDFFLL